MRSQQPVQRQVQIDVEAITDGLRRLLQPEVLLSIGLSIAFLGAAISAAAKTTPTRRSRESE